MSSKLALLVSGAAGRMGSRVWALAQSDARFRPAGRLLAETPEPRRAALLASCAVAVDFSVPSASLRLARACAAARKPLVVGTTGFSAAQRRELSSLGRRARVFLAPNFSAGVALLYRLAARACAALPGYDAAILEVHHKTKRDAPSGTALRLAEAAGRESVTIASQRVGAVVGEHTLFLAGPFERLELTHRAQSRDVFAQGALDAAAWLAERRKPGLYGMDDLLGDA